MKLYDIPRMELTFTIQRNGKDVDLHTIANVWGDSGGRDDPPTGEVDVISMTKDDGSEFNVVDLTQKEWDRLVTEMHEAAQEMSMYGFDELDEPDRDF